MLGLSAAFIINILLTILFLLEGEVPGAVRMLAVAGDNPSLPGVLLWLAGSALYAQQAFRPKEENSALWLSSGFA